MTHKIQKGIRILAFGVQVPFNLMVSSIGHYTAKHPQLTAMFKMSLYQSLYVANRAHRSITTFLKNYHCCWECKTCRDNERVVNASRCELCEENTWPDDETATLCETIDPTYLRWTGPISLGITLFAAVGLLSVLGTAVLYAKNSDTKLIKATSRELSAVLLFGIFLAYISVFTFVAPPTTGSCFCSRIGFNLSVSLIYAPLLVKTNRIFRIFAAGKKGNKRPKYIGSTAQMVITLSLIVIQV